MEVAEECAAEWVVPPDALNWERREFPTVYLDQRSQGSREEDAEVVAESMPDRWRMREVGVKCVLMCRVYNFLPDASLDRL